jgi:hypothetical protein
MLCRFATALTFAFKPAEVPISRVPGQVWKASIRISNFLLIEKRGSTLLILIRQVLAF